MTGKSSDEIVADFRARALEQGAIYIELTNQGDLTAWAVLHSQRVNLDVDQAWRQIRKRTDTQGG